MTDKTTPSLNVYSVAPFSGPRYHKNSSKIPQFEEGCAICGKQVVKPYQHMASVVCGGDWARTPEEVANTSDSGYMGVWALGNDCHKKYLVKDSSKA